jgi:hypothetical protein
MTVEPQGEKSNIILDARGRAGEFLNGYQIEASIVAPNGESQTVTFSQVAPGRYESEFVPTEQGIYLIHFSGKSEAGGDSFAETTGWALSYSPEYQRIDPDPDLLLRLSALGNGQVSSPRPEEVFKHDLKAAHASQPMAPWLLLIAALLLPFDIAVRRLIITRHDLVLFQEWVVQKLPALRPASRQGEPAPANPQMEALRSAKSRVRGSENVSAREMPIEIESTPSAEKEAQAVHPKPEQSTSTTSALLARKKNIRK